MLSKEVQALIKSGPEQQAYWSQMLRIAQEVHDMRTGAGLTQHELAKKMKTSQSTIGLWEYAGYDGYSLKKLYELARACGYTMEVTFFKQSTVKVQLEKEEDKHE